LSDLENNKGNIPPKSIPPPALKDNSTPTGSLIDSKTRNFRDTSVIFWMEKTAIKASHKDITEETKRLVILFIVSLATRII
jgi:hypothetical protein